MVALRCASTLKETPAEAGASGVAGEAYLAGAGLALTCIMLLMGPERARLTTCNCN
jgi:hypothetical protein